MLLRSSSTPILGSLLPRFSQFEVLPELSKHESLVSSENAKSLSFSSASSSSKSLTSPSAQSMVSSDAYLGEEDHWDADREVVWPAVRVRRAQSESDLQSLGLGSLAPVQLAASCFLSTGKLSSGPNENDSTCSAKKTWSRLSNRRNRKSFSATTAYLGAIGLDRDDFIPEEEIDMTTESECLDQSGIVFDESCLVNKDREIRAQSSATGGDLEAKHTEVSVKDRESCDPNHNMSNVQVFDASLSNREENAVFLGRFELMTTRRDSAQVNVGERYLSSEAGVNIAGSVVYDSQECTPAHIEEQSKVLYSGGGVDAGGCMSGGGGRWQSSHASSGGGSAADADITDLYYQKMLAENPGNPLLLRNYSQFLADVKRDFSKAEEYYARAILANPSDGEILAQYAKIIWDCHRDAERAGSYFERAVEAAPDDSYVVAAYAWFLWNSEGEEENQPATLLPSSPSLVSTGPA